MNEDDMNDMNEENKNDIEEENMNEMNEEKKKVTWNPPEKKKTIVKKEKQKRVITNHKKWVFTLIDLLPENQLHSINTIHQTPPTIITTFILQQIHTKLSSYKQQDLLKKKFSPDLFININEVIELLQTCGLQCFYCKNPIQLLYEYVREPTQWSLERLDNTLGHNKENVVIACLSCNIRRRTMYYERYVFTKQMKIYKSHDTC
jgi:hypothetical protein